MKVYDHFITVLGQRISIGIPAHIPYSEQMDILECLTGAEERRNALEKLLAEFVDAPMPEGSETLSV